MVGEETRNPAPTRREYVKFGGGVVGSGLSAGCTGSDESTATPPSESAGGSVGWTPEIPEDTTEDWPLASHDVLPDVDVSFGDVPQLMGEGDIDEEAFYEMDCDVHLFDPNFVRILDDSWTDNCPRCRTTGATAAEPPQGPVANPLKTEITAKQFYPSLFGDWRGFGETPDEERQFDRQRVADMINGNIRA